MKRFGSIVSQLARCGVALRRSRGSSIIEQALVYPIVLGVVIGAADISRIFQAYSVLDEGLRSALRCVTPANGDCIEPASATRETRYDVYQRSDTPSYRVQQYRYRGEAAWLTLPVKHVVRAEAAVVDSVSYSLPQRSYLYQLNMFRPQGIVGYAVQVNTLPYVELAQGLGMRPLFVQSAGSSAQRPPTVRYGAPGVELRYREHPSAGSRNVLSGTFSFTLSPDMLYSADISALQAHERCFPSLNGIVDFTGGCDTSAIFPGAAITAAVQDRIKRVQGSPGGRAELDQYAFIVLDIGGIVGSSGGAEGAVELEISQTINGADVRRELGGRRLSGNGMSNFVPRGAPTLYYSKELRNLYKDETKDYQGIVVRLGTPVKLTFTLKPDRANAESLQWRANEISVFTPRYRVETAIASCDTLVSREKFHRVGASACAKSLHPAGMPRLETVSVPSTSELTLQEEVCLADEQASGEAVLAERRIADAGDYRRVGLGSASCTDAEAHISCPENLGITGLRLTSFGEEVRVCNSAAAASLCPIPSGVTDACWKIAGKPLTVENDLRWTRSDCSRSSPASSELPVAWRGYREVLTQSENLPGVSVPLYTNGVAPEEFVDSHPQYRCDEIVTARARIGENPSELKPHSLFHSVISLGADFNNRLFLDAQSNFVDPSKNINPAAFFKAEETVQTVLSDSPPLDKRQIFWVAEEEHPNWTKIATGVLEGEFPAQCSATPALCRREFVSSLTQPTSGAEFSVERAQARAFAAVDAALPGLVHGCQKGAKGCATFSLEEERDPGGIRYVARGEVRVPLILSPKPYVVSRLASGRWEREFANR